MNKIALKGMQFYAYHGFYEEEQIMGAYYHLDVTVQVDFGKAGQNDQLADTLNYESIYHICKNIMATPAKLLEHIVVKIETQLIGLNGNIEGLQIVLDKLHPPLWGKVASSQVSIERNYQKTCARCQKGFLCHNNASCWCHGYTLSDKVDASLKLDYKGCLCENCLSEFGS
jgi:dihydroneopterin aldolase